MKKIAFTLITILLFSLTVLPFAFGAGTGSDNQTAAVKKADDFKDLKDLPQDVKDKFDSLIQGGVFNGLTDDTFGLDVSMNRAQFAKVAAIIFSLQVDKTLTTSSFADVSIDDAANSYALPYIEALKKAGLTNGYDAEGKTYKPSGEVSRQELAAFLIRGLGLDDAAKKATPVVDASVDDWAKGYVSLALEKKIMTNQDSGTFGGKTSATRRMLALGSYEAKQIVMGTPAPTGDGSATPPTVTPGDKTTPPTTTGDISAQGKKLLLISRQTSQMAQLKDNPDDEKIIARLKALGFRVSWINCDKVTAEKTAGFDIVVVSNTLNSKYLRSGWMKDVAIPTVYLKNHGMYYLGLSSIEENLNEFNMNTITITDPKEKAANGLSGDVQVLVKPDPKIAISYGLPGKEAIKIATIPGKSSEAAIYYYNKGTHSDSGYEVTARLSFYFFAGNYDSMTDNAWKLFDSLVLFTLQNG